MATPLDRESYVNLESFKMNGDGVKTPVWAAPLDGKLVVMTAGDSFKVKRLRRNGTIRVAACNQSGKVRGPWYAGTARLLDDAAHIERARAALAAKYGWQWSLLGFFSRLGGRLAGRAWIEITVGEQVAGA